MWVILLINILGSNRCNNIQCGQGQVKHGQAWRLINWLSQSGCHVNDVTALLLGATSYGIWHDWYKGNVLRCKSVGQSWDAEG